MGEAQAALAACPGNRKLLSALSLCKKAGKLAAGFDVVCEKAASGEAEVVFIACDTSGGTRKRVEVACERAGCMVRTIPLERQDIAEITRKPVGVMAVTGKDLAVLCLKALMDEEEPV